MSCDNGAGISANQTVVLDPKAVWTAGEMLRLHGGPYRFQLVDKYKMETLKVGTPDRIQSCRLSVEWTCVVVRFTLEVVPFFWVNTVMSAKGTL